MKKGRKSEKERKNEQKGKKERARRKERKKENMSLVHMHFEKKKESLFLPAAHNILDENTILV